MSHGDRAVWADLLPVVEAFVSGKTIHRKDYSGRWVVVERMTSLLCGSPYRVATRELVNGEWSVNYEYTAPNSLSTGLKAGGTFTWAGSDEDAPPWPNTLEGYKYSNERFTPACDVAQHDKDSSAT